MNLFLRISSTLLVAQSFIFSADVASAGGHRLSAGAFAFVGGSNPVSFSQPLEFAYTYINGARDREFMVGLGTGIGYGARFESNKGFYASLGGVVGVLPDPLVGPMSSFGWEFWCPFQSVCLSAEFRSAIALYSNKRMIPAYSTVQIGGTIWSN